MDRDLQHIECFIAKHHVLTLATHSLDGMLRACNLFYVYDTQTLSFVFASDPKTDHIQNILECNDVAGTIVLETEEVGKIEGLQFLAKVTLVACSDLKKIYFERYPYARVMQPTLWQCRVHHFKLTDNRFGFGKKIVWEQGGDNGNRCS
jgi:uncharacterized protein YhbP (UPF0306 family)